MKITFAVIALLSAILLLTSYEDLNVRPTRVRRIIIDAGHGGKDVGCLGKHTKEKDVALEVTHHLAALIKSDMKDVQVVYTRKSQDEFVELRERARLANKNNGDLFISIHCNSSRSSMINGTETYVMGFNSNDDNDVSNRENASVLEEQDYKEHYDGFEPNSPWSHIIFANYQNAYQANSLKVAHNIESQFKDRLNRKSRGVKQATFLVLWKTSMPSVLVETGFLSNSEDESYLKGEHGQAKMASALFRAIKEYKNTLEGN